MKLCLYLITDEHANFGKHFENSWSLDLIQAIRGDVEIDERSLLVTDHDTFLSENLLFDIEDSSVPVVLISSNLSTGALEKSNVFVVSKFEDVKRIASKTGKTTIHIFGKQELIERAVKENCIIHHFQVYREKIEDKGISLSDINLPSHSSIEPPETNFISEQGFPRVLFTKTKYFKQIQKRSQ